MGLRVRIAKSLIPVKWGALNGSALPVNRYAII